MSDAFSERMRLIRLRRKIEKPRFRDELKLVPTWLVWTLAFLYVVAVVLAIVINLYQDGGQSIQPSQLRGNPALASLAMAGIVTAVAIVLSVWLMALGYVYRDAPRREVDETDKFCPYYTQNPTTKQEAGSRVARSTE